MEEFSLQKTCSCHNCNFGSLFINCSYYGMQFTIGGIYNHPRGNISHFNSALDISISKIDSCNNVILAGDFNINIINYEKDDVLSYLTLLLSHSFQPCISYPSRITPYSATCIDHIFVRRTASTMRSLMYSGLFFCDISDHLPCFISFVLKQSMSLKDRPFIRLFGIKNKCQFVQSMSENDWNSIYLSNGDWFLGFMTKLKHIFDRSFPTVRLSRKRQHDKPWLTRGLKLSIINNHRLYKIKIRRPNESNTNKYKLYNRILRSTLKKAERIYYEQLFNDNKNASFNLWKNLGNILNPAKKRKSCVINKLQNEHGELVFEPDSIANVINDFFCNVGLSLKEKLPHVNNESFKRYLPTPNLNSFYLSPILHSDIVSEINKLKPKKSSGVDGIGATVLQLCPEIFADNLEKIFNHYIELGKYPDDLKIAKVIALYKKGDKTLSNNTPKYLNLICISKYF